MSFAKNRYNYFFFLLAFLMSFYLFKDIRYTDDFNVYENFYYQSVDRTGDIGYGILENIGRYFHLTFYQFYNYIVGLQLILFLVFFKKYRVNEVIGLFCTILILYVQMANQIRYFLALPLFLIAVNYLFCNKNYLITICLLLLAYSFHNGIIVLFSFIPLYYLIEYKKIKKSKVLVLLIVIGLICLYIYPILFKKMADGIERFELYNESVSRLATLFYMVFPCLSLVIIFTTYKDINIYSCSAEIRLSYMLSFFILIWMIASFTGIQIINARYVNALFPMWLTCMIKSNDMNANNKYGNIVLFMMSAFITKYLLPNFLFNFSDIDKIMLIWAYKQ